jgi:hypothetical protein
MPSPYLAAGGQGYPAHQTLGQSWPPRASASERGTVLLYELRNIHTIKRSVRTFGHRRLSCQLMGRFALSAGVERLVLPSFL